MIILIILLFIILLFRNKKEGLFGKITKSVSKATKSVSKAVNKHVAAPFKSAASSVFSAFGGCNSSCQKARRRAEEAARIAAEQLRIRIEKYNSLMRDIAYYNSETYKIIDQLKYYDNNFKSVQPMAYKDALDALNNSINSYELANKNANHTIKSTVYIQNENLELLKKIESLDPELSETSNVNKLLKNDVGVLGP